MRTVFLFTGIALLMVSVFAKQIGLDNDDGWGRARVVILILGLLFAFAGLLMYFFHNQLVVLKKNISSFLKEHLNFSYYVQIILISFAIIIFMGVVYFWLVQPLAKDARNKYNYYSELAMGFKSGQLYLAEKPSSVLLSMDNPYNYVIRKESNIEDFPWDVSLYNEKFYMYWGPAPSLILAVFGTAQPLRIGDHYITLLFAYGLFLYMTLIAASVWVRSFRTVPSWIFGMSLLAIGLSTPVTIMLKEARIYEAAIFGSQFFFIGGCYWAYSSINTAKPIPWKLALAGIHWALALGTRITILPVVFLSAAITAIYIWMIFKPANLKSYLLSLTAMGIPLLLASFSLGWYNWARFDSIFEFGLRYQLTNVDYHTFKDSFSGRYIFENISNYFFVPAQFQSKYPYLIGIENPFSNDKLAGLVYISPFILLLSVPFMRVFENFQPVRQRANSQQTQDPSLNWLIVTFASSAFVAMTVILCFYFAAMRYIEDFMPSLVLLIVILLGWEYHRRNWSSMPRRALAFVVAILSMFTLVANTLIALPRRDAAFVADLLNFVSHLVGLKLK